MSSWAIVLAAGEGSRLRSLTSDDSGSWTPKQYCSLRGGRTLLEEAIARARGLVAPERVLVIVAAEHRAHWEGGLAGSPPGGVPPENVIVQPRNRGTAAGLLLPVLAVLERDPSASVYVLPSDHHVEREDVLRRAFRRAGAALETDPERLVLLGITPDSPESGYGWIRPERGARIPWSVAAFVEKPPVEVARGLLEDGALWNSFLLAVRARTLVELIGLRLPGVLEGLSGVFAAPRESRAGALEACYEELEVADFSRTVLQDCVERIGVIEVPPCGWTDLGTPERVEACLRATRGRSGPPARRRTVRSGDLVLSRALAHARADHESALA